MATINRGDKVDVNGTTYYYYGSSEGNDFYTLNAASGEADCQLYYIGEDNNAHKVYVATAQGDITTQDLTKQGDSSAKIPNTNINFSYKEIANTTSTSVNYTKTGDTYMINEPSTVEQTTSNNTNSAITVPSLDIDPNIDSMSSIRNQTLPGRDGKEVMTYKGTADGYNYYADSIGNVYRRPVSGGSWEDCGCKSDSLTYSNNSTNTETTKEIYSDFGTYTTSADSNKIRNSIASEIDVIAKDIEKLISDIYKKIDGMPNNGAWEGESYNAFKNSVTSYKKNLDEFVTILKAFVVLFNNAADDTDDLGNIIDEIIGDL